MTFYRPVAYHTLKALLRVLKIGRINRINNEKSIQEDSHVYHIALERCVIGSDWRWLTQKETDRRK